MQIIGCDLHARQQTLAMLDTGTGEVVNRTLPHEGNSVREFYSTLSGPVRVGIEATGSMKWFLQLMEELGIDCQVGHPATIRAAEPRRQKHDRRDAELLLKLLTEDRFPSIWQPSKELLDLRALLLHRHQWVRLRTRIQNALQAIALANGLRRGSSLWSESGQEAIASLPLATHTAQRRSELQAMYARFEAEIEQLNEQVLERASERPTASWGDTSETTRPPRRDSRAVGKVCSRTEKIRKGSLETVGVVRDDAVIGDYVPPVPVTRTCHGLAVSVLEDLRSGSVSFWLTYEPVRAKLRAPSALVETAATGDKLPSGPSGDEGTVCTVTASNTLCT
jgi:hypothetical protein